MTLVRLVICCMSCPCYIIIYIRRYRALSCSTSIVGFLACLLAVVGCFFVE